MLQVLRLELFDLEPPPGMATLRWGLPHLGNSPRGAYDDTDALESPNVDASWVDRTVHYRKPDGRDYRLHEKRKPPPPQVRRDIRTCREQLTALCCSR